MASPASVLAAAMMLAAPPTEPYSNRPCPKSISRKERERRKAAKRRAKEARRRNR